MKVNVIREMYLSEILRNRYGLKQTPEIKKNLDECGKLEKKVMEALGEEKVDLFFDFEYANSKVTIDKMYESFVIGLRTGSAITRFMMKKKDSQR